MKMYAISKLNSNPPTRITWYPIDDSKEYITNFCQVANDAHAKAGTGEVFKVFEVK